MKPLQAKPRRQKHKNCTVNETWKVPYKHTTQYRKLWRVQPREILKWILNLSFYSNACKIDRSVIHKFFYINLCVFYSSSYLKKARAGRNML
jgi:hypothetical protein